MPRTHRASSGQSTLMPTGPLWKIELSDSPRTQCYGRVEREHEKMEEEEEMHAGIIFTNYTAM